MVLLIDEEFLKRDFTKQRPVKALNFYVICFKWNGKKCFELEQGISERQGTWTRFELKVLLFSFKTFIMVNISIFKHP